MDADSQAPRWQIWLVLAGGILAVSTAAIFVRLAIADAGLRSPAFTLFLAASRLAIAALILPLLSLGQPPRRLASADSVVLARWAGLCLAIHFATWITSLSYTSIAASTALVTTNPLWVALIGWLVWQERLSRRSLLGIGLALAGGLLIGWGSSGGASPGSAPRLGNGLALVGAIAASGYMILGREAQHQGLSTRAYGAIAYSTAALLLLPLPSLLGLAYRQLPASVYGWVLLMGIVPQLVGHTSINWVLRWVSPTWVSLAILFEPVGASLLGYWLFGERPDLWVGFGAGLLLLGVAIALLGAPTSPPKASA